MSLSGPTDGNIGDTLTFTVTATNKGPDDGLAFVEFAMGKDGGLTPVDWSPTCPSIDSPSQWIVQCMGASVSVGGTFQLTVHVHVDAIKETTVDGLAIPAVTDPDTTNNAVSTVVFPIFQAPPPPPPPPAITAPPYQFVDHLAEITIGAYSNVPFLSCTDGSQNCLGFDSPSTTVTAGSLPAGMRMNGTEIYGTPYEPGTYAFTLQATFSARYTTIEKQFTLVVDRNRQISTGDAPSSVVLPSKSRTPGVINSAVTQKTIKKTICVSGWPAKIRPPVSYMNTLKLKQMKQYGETGKATLYEEDQLVPLELGGAPRNPKNLWPEPHSEARHSDPLEIALKRKVCDGKLTLAAARKQILVYKRIHG